MRSDRTGTTGTTDAETPFRNRDHDEEPFQPSKQELLMIKTLKERREIARHSAQISSETNMKVSSQAESISQ